jgi:hypothetical protein
MFAYNCDFFHQYKNLSLGYVSKIERVHNTMAAMLKKPTALQHHLSELTATISALTY